MTDNTHKEGRDEVLFAFHRACRKPSAADIVEWISRYPELAEDIRDYAAMLRDADPDLEADVSEEDAVFFARGRSHAMNALHARTTDQTRATSTTSTLSFDQLMERQSLDIPQLARIVGITRGILSALISGKMAKPVAARLLKAITEALHATLEEFDRAHDRALASPTLGHAKGSASATIIRQTCEQIIQDSELPDDRKAYWLSED